MGYNDNMTQWWMVEQLAEQHRQDLARAFGAHSKALRQQEMKGAASLEVVPAAGTPRQRGARSARPPVGHHLGNLLIRAGIRLGGASMRTSS
jgi:hypothetical protein